MLFAFSEPKKNTTIAGAKGKKLGRLWCTVAGIWISPLLKANGEMRDREPKQSKAEQEGRWFNKVVQINIETDPTFCSKKKPVTGIMLFHRMTQSDYPLNVCVCLLYREKIVKVKNDDDDDENEDVRGRRPFRKRTPNQRTIRNC